MKLLEEIKKQRESVKQMMDEVKASKEEGQTV
jgi:hypothetical protein